MCPTSHHCYEFFHQEKQTKLAMPQSLTALNIPVRGWCQSGCLSHQTRPPLSSPLHLPFSPPSHFSASVWHVILCCRGNMTGRPAGFAFGSGISPKAVVCVCVLTEESGSFHLSEKEKKKKTWQFSKESPVLCHPPVSAHTVINLWWFTFWRQTKKTVVLLLVIHVALMFKQILQSHVLVKRTRSFLITVSSIKGEE